MVKFSKQFEGQLVPEWKEAFVDYWQLKRDVKKIHLLNSDNAPTRHHESPLNSTFFSSLKKFSLFGRQHRERVIQVHKKLASSASKGDMYETELLEQFADVDSATDFFACLDLQLNKVNQFFRTKEKEFLERGESLKKQLEILVELKTALKQQRTKGAASQDSKDDESISGTISCDEDSVKDRTEQEQGHYMTEETNKSHEQFMDSPKLDEMEKPMRIKKEDGKLRALSGRAFNCQGKNLRIHIPLTNPTRTFSYLLWDDLINQSSKKCGPEGNKVHINKTKLHHAEKMIRGALVELYTGLGYLKTYRHLNMLAFVKILKKFDKVTNKQALPIYLKVVETSYFNSSDMVMKLADEVEEIFVKHFAQENRMKAMKYLKPTLRKDSHTVTYFIGLFTGLFIALFVGYVIMAHMAGMYRPKQDTVYMETVYPLLRQVVMLDFFMADQLCSQVPMLRNLEYVACYYITGSYKTQDYGYCMKNKNYRDLAYAVSFLPYYWRAMQCARRWFDEGQTSHLVNLGKYVSAMLAAGAKVAYEKEKSVGWLCLVVVVSSGATVYQLYWDFVRDWGLLQFHSKNPWLRNELMLRRKFIYFFSMIFCFAVCLSFPLSKGKGLAVCKEHDYGIAQTLENEHLNNAGKFRAVKTVPLPFHEVDEQD
ncbi:hypothetical protein RJ639_045846 [Escallonia herrerae]|uniref:Uncharacterized protein n=1 Tax=Escallonia herrerae TaxID=1293975 RepID=A0AA89AXF7_9ASTE|nr:hypothetical protein RJ639_045846 [Escallonia herrerae]